MGARRKGRELALQALYRIDVTGEGGPEGLDLLWDHFGAPIDSRNFALYLVRGVFERGEEIDRLIVGALQNWTFERLSRVERNVLRIGLCELVVLRDTPTRVVVDEAIEIARRYGGQESGSFVHALLDRVAGDVGVREGEGRP